MYTDNFEDIVLFIPARKDGQACNHLKIVTAFTDVERISSHLIKLFDGRNKEFIINFKQISQLSFHRLANGDKSWFSRRFRHLSYREKLRITLRPSAQLSVQK